MLVNQDVLDKLRQELKDLNITKAENSKLKREITRLKDEYE
jgi:cell division protein FtsB